MAGGRERRELGSGQGRAVVIWAYTVQHELLLVRSRGLPHVESRACMGAHPAELPPHRHCSRTCTTRTASIDSAALQTRALGCQPAD